MKKSNTAALALSIMLLFSACQQGPAETYPQTAPSTIPETTAVPTTEATEPEPTLETGADVTVDGDTLAGGSVMYEDKLYIRASDFLPALDHAVYSGDDAQGFTVAWEGREIKLNPQQLGPVIDGSAQPLEQEMMVYQNALYLPLDAFCQLMNLSVLEDPQENHLYCTSGIMDLNIPEGIHVPVLMYHAISDDVWGESELFVSPSDMEAQLAYLVENGYDPIFFEDLPHVEEYDKPVILTFDDGYMDNYTELYPLLQKYNVKGTIFIITSVMGVSEHSMTREQVKELSDSDLVSIQSHTLTHQVLSTLSDEEQLTEIRDSRLHVTRMTGRQPHVLCYPTGARNDTSRELAAQYYNFGIDMNGGLYTTGEDRTTVSRYYVSRYTSLDEFASMVSSAGK